MKEEKSKKGLLSYHYKVSFEEYLVADRSKKLVSLIKFIHLKLEKWKYLLEKCNVVGCWNMMCDECSVQRLCWISKKLWSLCWLSGQSWSGHLIMKWKRKVTWFKQKSVERLLSWILSKEKFMPHDIKSIYIIFRWTRIQTPWNWSLSALEWPTTFPLFLPLIDWWDHLESWRKMLHFDHRRGLLLFIFVGSGHSRRFIPIAGNFKNVLPIYISHVLFVQNSEWCQIFFPPLSRVFSSGNGCCWLFVEEKQKTIAFGNNIIAFVTSTMREKVMGG